MRLRLRLRLRIHIIINSLILDSFASPYICISSQKTNSPNFSRLVESWKQQSGWEYKFYNDERAEIFLATHFPPEVKEAYDDLIPGAFKADLFRYCILFIYGGVYADIDVMNTSKLEVAIDDDVGFMIPLDPVSSFQNDLTVMIMIIIRLYKVCSFFFAKSYIQPHYKMDKSMNEFIKLFYTQHVTETW